MEEGKAADRRRRRAPRGMTSDVCPGCDGRRQGHSTVNGEFEGWAPRPKGSICGGCQQLLAEADGILRLEEERAAGRAAQTLPRNLYVGALDTINLLGWHSPIEKRARDALVALAEASGLETAERIATADLLHDGRAGYGDLRWSKYRRFSQDQLDAFRNLWGVLGEALNDAYQKGHEDGADLLRRLAAGDVTVFEYDSERARVEENGKP